MSELKVFITYDVDQDDANFVSERTALSWRGLELIPEINDELRKRGICHTFFVRFDNQIANEYGSYTALYEKHESLWQDLLEQGNEIGWHPHLYKKKNDEYHPLRCPTECVKILAEAWQSIDSYGLPIRSVRLGEAWHSNETMQCLDRMGIDIDSTALPMRRREDATREFDWLPTPNEPYFPSKDDYRLAGDADRLRILEVPMTTWPILTSYDREPLRRYLNPSFRTELFKNWLDGFFSAQDDSPRHLVVVFHPDELLPRAANGLHTFGWDTFRRNLDYLGTSLSKVNHRFCRLRDALE